MQDCKVDVAVTEDNVFLEQHVFSRGRYNYTIIQTTLYPRDVKVNATPIAPIMVTASTARVNAQDCGRENRAMKVKRLDASNTTFFIQCCCLVAVHRWM